MLVDMQIDEYVGWLRDHPNATAYLYVGAPQSHRERLIAALKRQPHVRVIREVDALGEIVGEIRYATQPNPALLNEMVR